MPNDDTLEQQILEYLETHPQASDTLEGIAQWWLLCHRVDSSVVQVKQTLELLKSKGTIHERRLSDGSNLYFLNEARNSVRTPRPLSHS
jgi:Fe2+ or Zn2+ uptake regulation protein